MKAKITPTEKIQTLKQNLEKHVEQIEAKNGELIVETENPEKLDRTPGIKKYTTEENEKTGLKGSPIDKQAYIKIENRKDAVKAFLATRQGYDLRVLDTGREWDLRQLKKYNPDIKHLKTGEPREYLGINNFIGKTKADFVKQVEVDTPEDQEQIRKIYREYLT
ncbi:MAG: hypothetical protein ABEJ83_04215 [Candidatus Nanohaloarchaea archaeon]